jgi:hypothetical protein
LQYVGHHVDYYRRELQFGHLGRLYFLELIS